MNVGRELRRLYKRSGLSVRLLATRTGMSRSKVGRLLSGGQRPLAEDLAILVPALGATMVGFYKATAVRVRRGG
jgi:transcriptional regulator with XRE-family HTH domain